jgi:DHA1 family bicyclomycin/chloramphenicol resistance-like MFS transporter
MAFNVHGRGFVVFLAAMAALPPLAIDMALPSLALIQADLGASQTTTAATIAIFLAGFSTAPLVVGPLADRFGRKPVLIVGLALFTVCGLGAGFAPSIGALLAFRLIQGAGAGAVGVLPRAIVRDLFEVRESRLLLSAIAVVQGVAPVVAPSLGAIILYVAPWRTIYLALAAIGVLLLAIGFIRFRESQPEDARQSLKPAAVAANYQRALTNRFCLGFSLILGLTFGGMFSYINTSPLLFMQGYGVSKAVFAGLFALTSMGVIAGAGLNSVLVRRHVKPRTALDLALSLTAVAALALLAVSLAGLDTFAIVTGLAFFYFVAMGLIFPNAAYEAVHPLPDIAGMASAILLSSQMLFGALGGALGASLYRDASPLGIAEVMTVAALFAGALYVLWLRPVIAD